jgi:hypothetical protein
VSTTAEHRLDPAPPAGRRSPGADPTAAIPGPSWRSGPAAAGGAAKRRRCDRPNQGYASTENRGHDRWARDRGGGALAEPGSRGDDRSFGWSSDPYAVDPGLILHYLELYFTHVNEVTYRMFPRTPFLRWLRDGGKRSSGELMVLYAMLTIASVFSPRPERKAEGGRFATIAGAAVGNHFGAFTLQLVQSRLLLALYHHALGDADKSYDYGGLAFRAAAGLRLNLEAGVSDFDDDAALDYGLSRHGLEECHRRTFWSAFLMDVSLPPVAARARRQRGHSGTAAIARARSASSTPRTSSSACRAARTSSTDRPRPPRPTSTTAPPRRP